MKAFLTKNIGLKIASLVAAVIIWTVVVNVSNPEIKASKGVMVEVENDDVILNAGKTYEITGSTSVTISYSVRTRDAYKVTASDFRAYVDMRDLYEVTGSVPITVEVINNKDLILDATAKPSVLSVNVEDVIKLTKTVEYELEGEPQDGYTVGSVELSPSSVTVSGPASVVSQIKTVKVVLDVDGTSEDIAGSAQPLFIDAVGKTIDIEAANVKANRYSINYKVNTLLGKTVPVQYDVGGTPAEGYSFSGVSASINQIAIRGSKAALADINSIIVPADRLDLAGTNTNKEIVIDLSEFIPSNLEPVGDTRSVVTLMVEGQEEKHFTISSNQIAIANGYSGCDYTVEPITLDVVLAGLRSDLETLNAHDILGSIDVANFIEEGTYSVEVTFTLPAGYALKSYSPVTVKINGTPNYAPDLSEEAGTELSETAESEDETEAEGEASEETIATSGNKKSDVETVKETTKETLKETSKETSKETTKETSKETVKETTKAETSEEVSKSEDQ